MAHPLGNGALWYFEFHYSEWQKLWVKLTIFLNFSRKVVFWEGFSSIFQ